VADEKLTLKGKLPEAANDGEDVHPLLRERRPLHAFDRSFALPKDVDIAKITAKLVGSSQMTAPQLKPS